MARRLYPDYAAIWHQMNRRFSDTGNQHLSVARPLSLPSRRVISTRWTFFESYLTTGDLEIPSHSFLSKKQLNNSPTKDFGLDEISDRNNFPSAGRRKTWSGNAETCGVSLGERTKHRRTNGSRTASVRRDDINGDSSALAACMSYGSAGGTGGTSLLACFDARPAAIQLSISDFGSFDLIPPNPIQSLRWLDAVAVAGRWSTTRFVRGILASIIVSSPLRAAAVVFNWALRYRELCVSAASRSRFPYLNSIGRWLEF